MSTPFLLARRIGTSLIACAALLLLGSAYAWADAPTPAPAPPAGTGVVAWTCELFSSPAPTTVPSPDPAGSPVPSPTTSPVPGGQACAATAYAPPAPVPSSVLSVHEVSPAPVDLTCAASPASTPSGTSSPAPTTAPGASSSPSPTSDEGCTVRVADEQWYTGLLFAGGFLVLALVAFVTRHAVTLTR